MAKMTEEMNELRHQLETMKLMLQKSEERNDLLEQKIAAGTVGIGQGPPDASPTFNSQPPQPFRSPEMDKEFPQFAFPWPYNTQDNGATSSGIFSSTPLTKEAPPMSSGSTESSPLATYTASPLSTTYPTPPTFAVCPLGTIYPTPPTYVACPPSTPLVTPSVGAVDNGKKVLYDGGFFDQEKQKPAYDVSYFESMGKDYHANLKATEGRVLERLNERLRAVEGGDDYEAFDLSSLSLVPEVMFPAKFKTPDFVLFTGGQCPKEHLHMYYRKMAAYRTNDELMMHVFQDSLGKGAAKWYTQLDKSKVKTMQELADAFIRHYKESIYVAPDWLQLQKLSKSQTETFQQYADRWRELAIDVRPALAEKDLPKLFVDSLGPPYYAWLAGSIRQGFAEVVAIGRRYEEGLKTGKITSPESSSKVVRPIRQEKKEEQGVHAVVGPRPSYHQPFTRPSYPLQSHAYPPAYPQYFPQPPPNPYPLIANTSNFVPPFQTPTQTPRYRDNRPRTPYRPPLYHQPLHSPRPNNSFRPPRSHTPIPISYAELLPLLIADGKIVKIPARQFTAPFPPWYRENEKCDFHMGAPGHDTENCRFLKDRVQELLDAGMLRFPEERKPDVVDNPLPNHGQVNNVYVEVDALIQEVKDVKTSKALIWEALEKMGMLATCPTSMTMEVGSTGPCCYCESTSAEHSIKNCGRFDDVLQDLMDSRIIQFGTKVGNAVSMISSSDSTKASSPQTVLKIHCAKGKVIGVEESELAEKMKPLCISVPRPFPYASNRAVPWKYEASVISSREPVASISGVAGMTRTGRVYGRSSDVMVNPEKEKTAEVKSKTLEVPIGNNGELTREEVVTKDIDSEFMKIVKQSKCKVIEQLKSTPAKISILDLITQSEPHRKMLLELLTQAQVETSITVEDLGEIVGNITTADMITFSDSEIPVGATGHAKPLHISASCLGARISSILIDNGSSLNVMPRRTLMKLPVDMSQMKANGLIVRAFDGSRREVLGSIDIPMEIGCEIFCITFQVMDIDPTYSCLLGRPWIHEAGVVPSTLHQKLKFPSGNTIVEVDAEEEFFVTRVETDVLVEMEEDAYESAFQGLEYVNAIIGGYFVETPETPKAVKMVANVMEQNGYEAGKGLGKHSQGMLAPLELPNNVDGYGLGYEPTREDRWLRRLEKRNMRRTLKTHPIEPTTSSLYPYLYHVFRPGTFLQEEADGGRLLNAPVTGWYEAHGNEVVAMAEDESSQRDGGSFVTFPAPDEPLRNWKVKKRATKGKDTK